MYYSFLYFYEFSLIVSFKELTCFIILTKSVIILFPWIYYIILLMSIECVKTWYLLFPDITCRFGFWPIFWSLPIEGIHYSDLYYPQLLALLVNLLVGFLFMILFSYVLCFSLLYLIWNGDNIFFRFIKRKSLLWIFECCDMCIQCCSLID